MAEDEGYNNGRINDDENARHRKYTEEEEKEDLELFNESNKEESDEEAVEDKETDIIARRERMKEHINAKELIDAEISKEMRVAYLNYAMSVIVARALPSAEDGLKPVHRRILWTMHNIGLQHNKQTKKSAAIVGDTMGKYHPHGDAAIYESMVRMAQAWSLRYPLVIGQGNFGSMDGDGPAAYRYTEAKMEKITDELLEDIDKNTVEMRPNFANDEEEPITLPGKIPNLLLNGASGIAVGMATNIPPHNLTNTCDTILHYIENPDCEIKDLVKQIKAPDFPTGGFVSGNFNELYTTGKGAMIIRGKAEIEEAKTKASKTKIIITEIPYAVNKATLVEEIANLVKDKKLPDVSDIRDESSKGKVRIVIEMRKDADPKFSLNRIYKYTQLQVSFSANMLALVGQQPKVLNLKEMVKVYVDHRRGVIRKRTAFELDKSEKRLHIVEGLIIAQSNIDAVVKIIRAAGSVKEASDQLRTKYSLSEKQAAAILEMKLSQLTSLEFSKLTGEQAELKTTIYKLQKILGDEQEIYKIIKRELTELKEKYGDNRRTKIMGSVSEFEEQDLVDLKDIVVTITDKGYTKRIDLQQYKEQRRGGRGVIGSDLASDDFVKQMITCSTHDYLLFFTDRGKVHWLKAHGIPEAAKAGKGKALINLLELKDEKVTSVISVKEFKDYLMMSTKKGVVKKIKLEEFANPRKGGIKAMKTAENEDTLIGVTPIKDNQEVLLVTKHGQAIRFNSDEVRHMGRSAYGITGIKLNKGDEVVSQEVLPIENATQESILTITEKGYGKRTDIEDYRLTGRAGKGVINLKITDKTGDVVTSHSVKENDTIIVSTKKGIVIRAPVSDLRIMGRATQGVRIIKLQESDSVSDLTTVKEVEDVIEEAEANREDVKSAD